MSEGQLDRLTLTPGTLLAGKYSVERVLGEGGMGVVVAATHVELHERVALKFLHPDAVENDEVAERFVREARAAVKIKNEHVARIIDVGRMDNGSPYMVMEYLEGHDLSAEKHASALSIEDAVDYVVQACDAMAEAHASGIVHRDLKPANLFLTQRSDGTSLVKVLDFGISKMTQPDAVSFSLTKTATAMGSPLYMSPEQMRSAKTVDHRTDIWSLGVILFELLAKTTPFTAGSLPELCAAILSDPPRNLRELRPDVPDELVKVVLKCLERDAANRYQNVAELANALAPFAPRRSRVLIERIGKVLSRAGLAEDTQIPVSVAVPGRSEAPSGAAATTVPLAEGARTNVAWSETESGGAKKKSTLPAALAGVVALVLVGGGAWMFTRSPATSPEPVATGGAAPKIESPATVRAPEPLVEPSTAVTPAAPAPSTAPAPSSSAARAKTEKPRAEPKAEPRPEPEAKPEPKPEPKPAPKPKNPLDIGLK